MAAKPKKVTMNEPTTKAETFQLDYGLALNFYNYLWDDADYIKAAVDYVKHANMKDYVAAVSKATASEVRTIGVLGRLIIRKQYVDIEYFEKMLFKLEGLKEKYGTKPISVKEKETASKLSIQERMTDVSRLRGGDVDEGIEKFIQNGYKSTFSMKTFLQANQIAGPIAKKIGEFYKVELTEIELVLAGMDVDLNEAYELVPKTKIKAYHKFLKMIVDDCGNQKEAAKVQRKPRVRKPKSPIKMTEKMVYKTDFPELNLRSIGASKIIGASELWTYNVVTRKLIVYQAIDKDGLGVKGSSITNFSELTSEVKTIRDPAKFFGSLKLSGKRAMATVWKAITTKSSKPKSRINKETILLTVN